MLLAVAELANLEEVEQAVVGYGGARELVALALHHVRALEKLDVAELSGRIAEAAAHQGALAAIVYDLYQFLFDGRGEAEAFRRSLIYRGDLCLLNLRTEGQQLIDDEVHGMHVQSLADFDHLHEVLLVVLLQLLVDVRRAVEVLDVEEETVLHDGYGERPHQLLDLNAVAVEDIIDLVRALQHPVIGLELAAESLLEP